MKCNDMEFPERKNNRLEKFDYSQNGVYFITICVKDRKSILGKVRVGEGSPLPIVLSSFGKIVDEWINKIPEYNDSICVDKYVIMPDHIHLLLSIKSGRGNPSPTISSIIGWLKYNCTKDINSLRDECSKPIFQRSFYDHIIRNQEDYNEKYDYIENNLLKLFLKIETQGD